ncbi:MAG: hypothetical protein EB121_02005, partial [Alphaproteobacteria bacterium]|nr:hypothetical protein [Alphaproteobacteria bacterium]
MDFTPIAGILGTIARLTGDALYVHSVAYGRTRPHIASQLPWAVIGGIIFASQIAEEAGPSIWIYAVNFLMCVVYVGLALWRGTRDIKPVDWVVVGAASLGIPFWLLAHDPLYAVLWVTAIDIVCYYPICRKSWNNPWSEPRIPYLLSSIKHVFILLALVNFNLTTSIYSFAMIVANIFLVGLLLLRRRQLQSPSAIDGG